MDVKNGSHRGPAPIVFTYLFLFFATAIRRYAVMRVIDVTTDAVTQDAADQDV